MKKVLFSAFVVVTFMMYAIHQKTEGVDEVPVIVSPAPSVQPTKQGTALGYKDGQYTGSVADAYYGNIQVRVTIQNGKITDVLFLDYPHDRGTSVRINTQAMPILRSEAIQVQNANVDIVSGATDSSSAFRESLASAIAKAR
jgi:uncharacterized protein with FMN-binding domain